MHIIIGARQSALSQAQVEEVLTELQQHYREIAFTNIFVATTGDKDQNTSLRTLEKTDFFTKEIDQLLLQGKCQIGIHSAKDLPDPLTKGLIVVAITHGVDPSDSLVLRYGETLAMLKSGATVATSSIRREEVVKQLRHDLHFIDVRGTIAQRLAKLDSGDADAVVVAEAALIRLRLTDLNRLRLPGNTAPFQGQLAIVAREGDQEMANLFAVLDVRA